MQIRSIIQSDLPGLLFLYRHLHPADAPLPDDITVDQVWHDILNDPKIHCLVAEQDGELVGSCTLVIIPNLTRGARPYGLIENVVTHAGYRKQGIGAAILQQALRIAWEAGCYKAMLMTGSKREEVHRFYEKAGFVKGGKTGFVATPHQRSVIEGVREALEAADRGDLKPAEQVFDEIRATFNMGQ
jgi:GNAT superfamily N-acetyltransferase